MKYTLRSLNLLKFCAGRSSIGGKDGARTKGEHCKSSHTLLEVFSCQVVHTFSVCQILEQMYFQQGG